MNMCRYSIISDCSKYVLFKNIWLTSNHLLYRMHVSFNYTVDELHVMDNVIKTVTQQVTSLSANIVT